MAEPLAAGPGYRVERRILPPGRMLALRYRCRSAEHLTVVAGEVHLTIGDDTMVIETDDSVYVPFGAMHRLANRGTRTAVIIAVACGDADDDIVHLEG
jgi:mannose-6-phosphate isomerase-like protein (cupin superfamily)